MLTFIGSSQYEVRYGPMIAHRVEANLFGGSLSLGALDVSELASWTCTKPGQDLLR